MDRSTLSALRGVLEDAVLSLLVEGQWFESHRSHLKIQSVRTLIYPNPQSTIQVQYRYGSGPVRTRYAYRGFRVEYRATMVWTSKHDACRAQAQVPYKHSQTSSRNISQKPLIAHMHNCTIITSWPGLAIPCVRSGA